jgi:tryptophan synthase beta subunit
MRLLGRPSQGSLQRPDLKDHQRSVRDWMARCDDHYIIGSVVGRINPMMVSISIGH